MLRPLAVSLFGWKGNPLLAVAARAGLSLSSAGKYALWGKVLAWDGNSDSLWVTWQPADPDEDAQATKNVQFRWSVAGGPAWHWDRINHWLDAGTFNREWKFNQAGKTT